MNNFKDAINSAIDECIKEGYIADFLTKRRDEVVEATMIDMTFEAREKLIREEAREDALEEGRAEGREEGKAEGRIGSISLFFINGGSEEDAHRFLNATDEEIKKAKEGMPSV